MSPDEGLKPQKQISKLKSQIRKWEKERNKVFPDLGQQVYSLFKEGKIEEPSLVETCRRIESIDEQSENSRLEISRLQEQIRQMKAAGPGEVILCSYCQAPLAPGTKFCGNCGKEVPSAAPAPAMACPKCGAPISAETKFCGSCGAPVQQAQAPGESPAAPAPPADPSPPPSPPGAEDRPGKPGEEKASAPPTTPKSKPEGAPPPPEQAPSPPGASEKDKAAEEDLKCPACGAIITEKGAVFCGECGTRL